MSKREWIKKITVIIIGSVIAAYGITLALYAGFGGGKVGGFYGREYPVRFM